MYNQLVEAKKQIDAAAGEPIGWADLIALAAQSKVGRCKLDPGLKAPPGFKSST